MNKVLQNKVTIITLIISIIFLVFFTSIVYSAFSSTMNITGIAYSRVETDVRITDFSIYETNNATSSYEEFSKNTIFSHISFNNENSYIIYKVEVTNYGATNVGIYSIDGIPENITYELIDYNLKEKICDSNGKCNNFAVKTFYIKLIGSNKELEYTLDFDFREIYKITYKNITGNYPTEAFTNELITLDFSNTTPKFVYIRPGQEVNHTYKNNILSINNINCDIEIEASDGTYNYPYTGNYQTMTVPTTGIYKIELWGAAGGGNSLYSGGSGGYTSGTIKLIENEKLYVYVGSKGKSSLANKSEVTECEFNGGGRTTGQVVTYDRYWGTGGGATDIRLVSGNWKNFESLKSRIMVAGAGGGGHYNENYVHTGGAAGGLIGISAPLAPAGYGNRGTGGTQTSGGYNELTSTTDNFVAGMGHPLGKYGYGGFGYGGHPELTGAAAGGGSGYYGGGSSSHVQAAGGGSSFISGHNGCNAITESSTETNITHTGQSIHYSNKKFVNTTMIDGEGYKWATSKGSKTDMPSPTSASTMTGNTGNGYAKITLIKVAEKHKIVYTGIDGNYQTIIETGEDLIIDFKENAPANLVVMINEKQVNNYKYQNGILTVPFITEDIQIINSEYIYNYSYTGDYQTFTVPYTGVYKVELWGAQGGGGSNYQGGLGGYTSGKISLQKDDKLYVYVGSKGSISVLNDAKTVVNCEFNGGGSAVGQSVVIDRYWGTGGGATDIRLTPGTWNDFESLKSRIMVAGAGGGAYNGGTNHLHPGGIAGGLIGGKAPVSTDNYGSQGSGGTQTIGGYNEVTSSTDSLINLGWTIGKYGYGGFGYGGDSRLGNAYAGGGSGYYGGGSSSHVQAGGGGSSFISGHNGCDAIKEESNETSIVHTGQSIHYSGYKFTDTKIIDGEGYSWSDKKESKTNMPTHDGTSTMEGNEGNGYAKVTLIEMIKE